MSKSIKLLRFGGGIGLQLPELNGYWIHLDHETAKSLIKVLQEEYKESETHAVQ